MFNVFVHLFVVLFLERVSCLHMGSLQNCVIGERDFSDRSHEKTFIPWTSIPPRSTRKNGPALINLTIFLCG